MSICSPCVNCFGIPNSPRNCGIDPCFTYKTGTTLVYYTSSNLPNTGIDTCDTLSTALQKIDNALLPATLVSTLLTTLSTNTSLRNQLKTILGI